MLDPGYGIVSFHFTLNLYETEQGNYLLIEFNKTAKFRIQLKKTPIK